METPDGLRVRPLARLAQWTVLVALCVGLRPLQAQSRWFRVVSDRALPVAGATVAGGGSSRALVVDSAGYVAMSDSELRGTVYIRALGFRSLSLSGDSLRLATAPTDTIHVSLTALAPLLGAVEVTSDRIALGGSRITRDVASRLPPLGEPDILRVLPLIGGISQTNDIRPRLHLAGAAGDESLVTLDGHPLQHGLHFDGLLGAFNLASLDRADVLMHQVPASARTRAGGVITLATRTTEARIRGDVGVSLAAVTTTISAPLGGVRMLASGRSTWSSKLLERVLSDGPAPGFRDGVVRLTAPLGARTEATLLGFGAYNLPTTLVKGARSGMETSEALGGATITTEGLGMQWAVRASRSQFRAQSVVRDEVAAQPDAWQRWDAASLDASRRSGRRWLDLHASIDAREHQNAWNRAPTDNPLLPRSFAQSAQQRLLHAAIAGGTGFGRTSFDGGARFTRSSDGVWVAPQVNALWNVNRQFDVGASLGRRWQFDSEYGEPVGASGAPPPVFLLDRPRRMDAGSLTLALRGASEPSARDARLEMTGFVRRFADRTVPNAGTRQYVPVELVDGKIDFLRTTGRAYGVSTTVSARSERGTSLQVAYTWQRAWQRDSAVDVRAAWDIPHTLSTLASVPIGRRLELSGVVTWRSGAAVTPVVGALSLPFGDFMPYRVRYGALNSARLPDYLRVDAMLRWRARLASTDVALTFQLINALARENVMGYRLDSVNDLAGTPLLPSDIGVPFLPSLGFEVRW